MNACISAPTQTVFKHPGKGYEIIPGHGYYKLSSEIQPWLKALQRCTEDDAHLLILDSKEEAKALIPLLKKHPRNLGDWRDHYFFIGIHDLYQEGTYYTIHGKLSILVLLDELIRNCSLTQNTHTHTHTSVCVCMYMYK